MLWCPPLSDLPGALCPTSLHFIYYDLGLLFSPSSINSTSVCICCIVCFGVIFKGRGQKCLYSAILKLAGHEGFCGPAERWGLSCSFNRWAASYPGERCGRSKGKDQKQRLGSGWLLRAKRVSQALRSIQQRDGWRTGTIVWSQNKESWGPRNLRIRSSRVEKQGGGLEDFQRQTGDVRGDFKSHSCTSLNMLPRSFQRIMMDRQFDTISFHPHLRS